MEDLIRRVNENETGIYRRESELIVVLPETMSTIIGDSNIFISEFIIAKVKEKIEGKIGHPEITDEIFLKIPSNLSNPKEILQDTRYDRKYLFISIKPLHEIVVEVSRKESGKSEINTIHLINPSELKRLENKFPVIFSSGGTPGLPHTCIP